MAIFINNILYVTYLQMFNLANQDSDNRESTVQKGLLLVPLFIQPTHK